MTGDNQRSPRVSNFALLFFSRAHPVEQSLANIIIIMGDYSLHTPLGGAGAQMSLSYDSIDFAWTLACLWSLLVISGEADTQNFKFIDNFS